MTSGQTAAPLIVIPSDLLPSVDLAKTARIEINKRKKADGSVSFHGMYIQRGSRRRSGRGYLGHIPGPVLNQALERIGSHARKIEQ